MRRLLAFGLALVLAPAAPLLAQAPPTVAVQAYQAGQAALAREDFARAEKEFRIAIKGDRLFSLAYYGLGTTLGSTRRYAEALEAFKQAIATHRERLAQQHVQAAKLDQARDQEIQELRDSLRNIGAQKFASAHAGTLLEQRIQQLEREKGREKAALAQQPPVPVEFYVALGGAHARLEQVAEARAAFVEALEIDPKRGDVQHNLAVLALAEGDRETAREHIRLAEAAGFRVSPDVRSDAGLEPKAAAAPNPATPPAAASSAPAVPAPSVPAATRAATFTIEHEPLACAAVGRSPLIEAAAGPDAAEVRVRFSAAGSLYQYLVRMKPEGGRFVTRLPRPKAGLESFTYSIDATDKAMAFAHTEEVTVRVSATAEECPGREPRDTRQALLVEVPASAPARPPVPDGFSDEGVKGTGGTKVGMTNVPAKLGAAVGVIGVVAGAAYARGSIYDQEPSEPNVIPPTQLEFLDMQPPPGSTVVAPNQQVQATFRITVPRATARLFLRVRLRDGRGASCFEIAQARDNVSAGDVIEMTAVGPANASPFCGATFDVLSMGVDVQADTDFLISNRSFPASYKVVRQPG